MTRADVVADILDATANVCRTARVDDWTAEDFDRVLRSCNVVATEVVGLAQKIRGARVRLARINATPRPVPMKPRPAPKPGTTMPKQDPPKEPGK